MTNENNFCVTSAEAISIERFPPTNSRNSGDAERVILLHRCRLHPQLHPCDFDGDIDYFPRDGKNGFNFVPVACR
ncbi:unnamed protein product [Rhodiola kirilowii]